jgi:hypothetical protein
LAISYDIDSRIANAVCIGLLPHEILAFIEYLKLQKESMENPLFLSIALADLSKSDVVNLNRKHIQIFLDIQRAMKTDDFIVKFPASQEVNLVDFAKSLKSLATSSAGLSQLCASQVQILNFLSEQLEMLKLKKDDLFNQVLIDTLSHR